MSIWEQHPDESHGQRAHREREIDRMTPCEDAPCCGHGGVCGRALGMSIEAYEDGFDTRSDEEIKQAIYESDDLDWDER